MRCGLSWSHLRISSPVTLRNTHLQHSNHLEQLDFSLPSPPKYSSWENATLGDRNACPNGIYWSLASRCCLSNTKRRRLSNRWIPSESSISLHSLLDVQTFPECVAANLFHTSFGSIWFGLARIDSYYTNWPGNNGCGWVSWLSTFVLVLGCLVLNMCVAFTVP